MTGSLWPGSAERLDLGTASARSDGLTAVCGLPGEYGVFLADGTVGSGSAVDAVHPLKATGRVCLLGRGACDNSADVVSRRCRPGRGAGRAGGDLQPGRW